MQRLQPMQRRISASRPSRALVGELGVGDPGAGHAHQVAHPLGEQLLGHHRVVHPAREQHRHGGDVGADGPTHLAVLGGVVVGGLHVGRRAPGVADVDVDEVEA